MIEILDFEFMGVDCEYYESKESRYGNVGFYAKGDEDIRRQPTLYLIGRSQAGNLFGLWRVLHPWH